jgi:plasmid stability protein
MPAGRPSKPDALRLRRPIAVRLREDLKSQIAVCAAKMGRSVSEEIEARLERSLLIDEVRIAIREELGSKDGQD